MDWSKVLTPKNTEEVRPGLFIQKRNNNYRQIHPAAWNGKVDWKGQMKSVFSFRTVFTMGLILFIYFGYLHDYRELQNFYEEVMDDEICKRSLESKVEGFDMSGFNIEVNKNERSDTSSLPSNT